MSSSPTTHKGGDVNAAAREGGGDLISDLRELVGYDAVLLPIPQGQKGPKIKGWRSFASEKMKEPEYLAQLNLTTAQSAASSLAPSKIQPVYNEINRKRGTEELARTFAKDRPVRTAVKNLMKKKQRQLKTAGRGQNGDWKGGE
jgi:hypothetical protein